MDKTLHYGQDAIPKGMDLERLGNVLGKKPILPTLRSAPSRAGSESGVQRREYHGYTAFASRLLQGFIVPARFAQLPFGYHTNRSAAGLRSST